MGLLMDLLGALMIATLLMLMMISFQFQLRDTANRTMYTSQMLVHEQSACSELNKLVGLVGIGVAPDSTVAAASASSVTFLTRWSYITNAMLLAPVTLQLTLETATGSGKMIRIVQGGTVTYELGRILWVEDLSFKYYDNAGTEVTTLNAANIQTIRSVDINITFMRNAPKVNTTPLRTKVQLRIYFMNCYLQEGAA
jgi:hypothetical protein